METGFPPDSGWDAAARQGTPAEPGADIGAKRAGDAPPRAPGEAPSDEDLIRLSRAAEQQSVTFARENWRSTWASNYKQFRSEYTDNSKYKSDDYRHRSKVFRPKTKIAVIKDMAAAAETLFGTVDVVTVSASDETDPQQVANAEVQNALLNYRLDRTSGKNAIPWFMTVMGARQDCQITGICCAKAFWRYETKTKRRKVKEIDEATGAEIEREVEEEVVVKDKPDIDLIPGENLCLDPAAYWVDPVNSGAYFGVRYPVRVMDVKRMVRDRRRNWRQIDLDNTAFAAARVKEFESAEVRRAREGGSDRTDQQNGTITEFDVVWIVEWFIRDEYEDWCFWTLGSSIILSDAIPTEEAYPERGGERPYRIGYGNLEAHRIVPQSPVETLTPLQLEINDITNLRLDGMKQAITPVAMVKRGKKVDTEAVKRRYPVLYVDDTEGDIVWDRPPDNAASAFAETSRLDTDFDDLAGTFNGGSVANNRQVGETVGGMRLMAGSANAISSFYMKLFIETCVEPLLSDISRLEAYYESDEKILALARRRAPSMKKFGIDELTDDLLTQEVIVRVSAGSGDRQMRLQKIATAIDLTAKIVPVSQKFKTGEIRLNEEALINEIWANADIRDAFTRFFEQGQPMPQPGDGEAAPAGASPEEMALEASEGKADRENQLEIAQLKSKTDIVKALIGHRADETSQRRDHHLQARSTMLDAMLQAIGAMNEDRHRSADRAAAAQQSPPQPAAPPVPGMPV